MLGLACARAPRRLGGGGDVARLLELGDARAVRRVRLGARAVGGLELRGALLGGRALGLRSSSGGRGSSCVADGSLQKVRSGRGAAGSERGRRSKTHADERERGARRKRGANARRRGRVDGVGAAPERWHGGAGSPRGAARPRKHGVGCRVRAWWWLRVSEIVKKMINQTNEAQLDANQKAEGFARDEVGLTETVLAVNKADMSLRMLMEVRNRALEAYRELTRAV